MVIINHPLYKQNITSYRSLCFFFFNGNQFEYSVDQAWILKYNYLEEVLDIYPPPNGNFCSHIIVQVADVALSSTGEMWTTRPWWTPKPASCAPAPCGWWEYSTTVLDSLGLTAAESISLYLLDLTWLDFIWLDLTCSVQVFYFWRLVNPQMITQIQLLAVLYDR